MSTSSHFLSLDVNKKPTVRKGVSYQSFVPPVLPPKKPAPGRPSSLKKVQAAYEMNTSATIDKIHKSLPELGPFNTISHELAHAYIKEQDERMKVDDDAGNRQVNYWDDFEESLDRMIKQESVDDANFDSPVMSVSALRSMVARIESWIERAIKASLGTGQTPAAEIDELLEECALIQQRVELPRDLETKLRVMQKVGEKFAAKVRSKVDIKNKDKVALRVLTDLMKEAEALPIETAEVKFFRNQKGRIEAICHSAQKATRDKSLDKSKEVTLEAAEVRAILPDLDFLKDQVSMGEWVQKAISKTDKRASVTLQTIEQLFDDPSAALIKPENCEIMRVLKQAMDEAREWQAKATGILDGIVCRTADNVMYKKYPTLEELQALQDQHSNLNKICIPALSTQIEGVIRRAKGWLKKQERTLSGTWGLADAKNLLDEGRQISMQADLNPEIGNLEKQVLEAEQWCVGARTLIRRLALSEIDQIEPLVSSSFKATTPAEASPEASPAAKRVKRPVMQTRSIFPITGTNPNYTARLALESKQEQQGLRNYESALGDLLITLSNVESYILPLLESDTLPAQTELETLKATLGIVRDIKLEDDITQLYDGAMKWSDRAESVLAVPFPRPCGVLRSLATLIHDLATSPMKYRYWNEIIQVAREETWAHALRYVTLPLPEALLSQLVESCPFPANQLSPVPAITSLEQARELEREVAADLTQKQNEWMRQVLGLRSDNGLANPVVPNELSLLLRCQAVHAAYVATCNDLLTPRRLPMHTKREADVFMDQLGSAQLVHATSLVTRVQLALNKNAAFEAASHHLKSRMDADYTAWKSGESVPDSVDLFHDLLALLESVEFAELKVEHFDQHFAGLVSKLLQYQANIRALFHWDHDESVIGQDGFRPLLSELDSAWTAIQTEADQSLHLSANFLRDVAYLTSAHRILLEASQWRSTLVDLANVLRGQSPRQGENGDVAMDGTGAGVSIVAVKRHVSKWAALAVKVPYEDVLSNAEMSAMDEWSRLLAATISGRAKQRKRATLAEAESLLAAAPRPLCANTSEFDLLATQVRGATELNQLSSDTILASFEERSQLVVPLQPAAGDATAAPTSAADADSVSVELHRLMRECKKSPIRVGTEQFIEQELRVRAANRTLTRILARPQVVPTDLVEQFLASTAEAVPASPETGGDAPAGESMEDEGMDDRAAVNGGVFEHKGKAVSFAASVVLADACRALLHKTHSWNHSVADFLSVLPQAAVSPVPTSVGAGRKAAAAVEQPWRAQLEAALNAPPTTAGEKFLDIILRNLDKDVAVDFVPTAQVPAPEYTYPLPLYHLPGTELVEELKPQGGSGKQSSSRRAGAQQRAEPAVAEGAGLIDLKGAHPLLALQFRVPWTRPGLAYLSPLVEQLSLKPREFCLAEKEKLRSAIAKRGLALGTALDWLLVHKRGPLFQTPEYVRTRALAAVSLKSIKTGIARFPYLLPKALAQDDTEIPIEQWEKYLSAPTDAAPAAKDSEEGDLISFLLQLESLQFQVPTKYRLLMVLLDLYDWRVRAQCVCHHMDSYERPRPWAGDERALSRWATCAPPMDVFQGVAVPTYPQPGDPLCMHVVVAPPPADFVLCAMHMSFYYVVESSRHFIRVMSDMCELCYGVTTTDQEDAFWISCDACDKWFHGPCAGLTHAVQTFTCPNCVISSSNAPADRKRTAMSLLQSLPPKRHTPVPPEARLEGAAAMMGELSKLPVVSAVAPNEIGIFKRLLPSAELVPDQPTASVPTA